MRTAKILRNSAKCRKCGDEIESTHRHDFQACRCRTIFIDGGKDYIKCGGDPESFTFTGIVIEEKTDV